MKTALFLLSLSFSQILYADSSEQDYQNLCSYDRAWCGKLKNSDGTFVRPKKEIVLLLKELAPVIEAHSATLGVDPRAVAGAIMAENSLNVSISDDVQNLLVKIGVANKGEIFGKKFTYGLGQLNFYTARDAENYAAKLEKRAPLSDATLSDALLVPDKAVYYVAAVIRKVQDDYQAQGIDISGKPEILSTLYNLGNSTKKAKETKANGLAPRPNYFGFFVKKYESELSFLKKASPENPVAPIKVVAEKSVTKPNTASISKPIAPVEKKLKLVFTKSAPLYTSPPSCEASKDYGSTNLKRKYETMKNFAVSGIVEKNHSFDVIAPTIDCEANPWELIKTSSGEIGWIKKEDLEKNTTKALVATPKCSNKPEFKCVSQLKEEYKDLLVEDKSSEVFLRPFSPTGKSSFKTPDWECRDSSRKETDKFSLYNSASTSGYPGGIIGGGFAVPTRKIPAPVNTDEDLKKIVEKIDLKMKEIENFYQAPLDSPKNPFANSYMNYFKTSIQRCADKQLFKLDVCALKLDRIETFLASVTPQKNFSQEDLGFINHNAYQVSMGQPMILKKDYQALLAQGGYFGSFGYTMGGYNAVGGTFGLPSQYLFREGDEKIWGADDLEAAYKNCNESLDALESKIAGDKKLSSQDSQIMMNAVADIRSTLSSGAMGSLKKVLALPEENKVRAMEAMRPDFVQAAKLCLSLDDTFSINQKKPTATSATKNYQCFYQNLEVLESGNGLMLKGLLHEMMYSSGGLMALSMYFHSAFTPTGLSAFLPMSSANTGGPMLLSSGGLDAEAPTRASYCPNKTAEQIESMVKKYPCVSRVYVPDHWMVNRLNELGNKVLFRPFADDDRYSVSVENAQCN